MQNFRHFTWEELTKSATGKAKGIRNVPNQSQVNNITDLVNNVLEPLRECLYKKPILVSSCFRCEELNRAVGGAKNSQHMAINGAAADIYTKGNKDNFLIAELIIRNLEFDQLIFEKGTVQNPQWIHVSYNRGKNRRQTLYYDGKKYSNVECY